MVTKKPKTEEAEEVVQAEEEVVAEEKSGNGAEKYFKSIGRRKESTAVVRLYTRKSTDPVHEDRALITVNDKDYTEYFTNKNLHAVVESPLKKLKSMNRFKATVKVSGGGS